MSSTNELIPPTLEYPSNIFLISDIALSVKSLDVVSSKVININVLLSFWTLSSISLLNISIGILSPDISSTDNTLLTDFTFLILFSISRVFLGFLLSMIIIENAPTLYSSLRMFWPFTVSLSFGK